MSTDLFSIISVCPNAGLWDVSTMVNVDIYFFESLTQNIDSIVDLFDLPIKIQYLFLLTFNWM